MLFVFGFNMPLKDEFCIYMLELVRLWKYWDSNTCLVVFYCS